MLMSHTMSADCYLSERSVTWELQYGRVELGMNNSKNQMRADQDEGEVLGKNKCLSLSTCFVTVIYSTPLFKTSLEGCSCNAME
jgi:hypothetical protein